MNSYQELEVWQRYIRYKPTTGLGTGVATALRAVRIVRTASDARLTEARLHQKRLSSHALSRNGAVGKPLTLTLCPSDGERESALCIPGKSLHGCVGFSHRFPSPRLRGEGPGEGPRRFSGIVPAKIEIRGKMINKLTEALRKRR